MAAGNLVVRRIGDPSAREFRTSRAFIPVTIGILALVVITAVATTWHWVEVGDFAHMLGAGIGIAITVVILTSAALVWRAYWMPLVNATRRAQSAFPDSVVFGARLPALDNVEPQAWAPDIAPQQKSRFVVLVADAKGISLHSADSSAAPIAEFSWSSVGRLDVVQYVEAKIAYHGIAVLDPTGELRYVLQVLRTSGTLIGFPTEAELARMVSRLSALHAGTEPSDRLGR